MRFSGPLAFTRGPLRAIAAFSLALAGLLAVSSCDNSAADMPVLEADPPFFVITDQSGAIQGWLLGTIHALPPSAKWRTGPVAAAIKQADLLIVEVAALDDAAAIARIFKRLARSPRLPPLPERLPADQHSALAAAMERADIAPGHFAGIETWAAALALARQNAVGDPKYGVDRAVIADFAGRPVRELEGASAQLTLFDELSEEDQRAMLESVIGASEPENDDGTNPAEKLLRAWAAGDMAVIAKATREGMMADPSLREAILVQRNRNWARAIAPMLKDDVRPLIAVGAAHLATSDGLPALLEAEGYRTEQVKAGGQRAGVSGS